MIDSITKSLLRGRMLAAVSGASAAGISTTAALTDAVNEATALATAILALVSALAAVYSKVRELKRTVTIEDAVRKVVDEHRDRSP